METSPQIRMDYASSCRHLQTLGWLEPGEILPLPLQHPKYDDTAQLGVRFFRTRVEDDGSNMTLIPAIAVYAQATCVQRYSTASTSSAVTCETLTFEEPSSKIVISQALICAVPSLLLDK